MDRHNLITIGIGSVITLLVALLFALTVISAPQQTKPWDCLGKIETQTMPRPDSGITTLNFQIDGTPSMEGYVNQPDSLYIRTLRLIDNAGIKAFPASVSQYYKFGLERVPLQESSLKFAEQSQFYLGTSQELNNVQLEQVIQPIDSETKSNELYIIVTDLYQQDGQWKATLEQMKKYYLLNPGYAVGIIGIKSQFNGTIYDIGLRNAQLAYNSSLEDVDKFQPFYIITLGNYYLVKSFFDAIKNGSESEGINLNQEQMIIFTNQLVESQSTLRIDNNQPEIYIPKNNPGKESSSLPVDETVTAEPRQPIIPRTIFRQRLVNDGKIIVNPGPQSLKYIERLRITKNHNLNQKIVYQSDYNHLPYTLLPNPPLNTQISPASDYNQRKKSFTPNTDNQLDDKLAFSDWQISPEEIDFKVSFNFGQQDRGIYRLMVDIFPRDNSLTERAFQTPEWWRSWNLGETDPIEGSKTYNLLPFMEALSYTSFGIIKETNPSPMGRFCFLIHRE